MVEAGAFFEEDLPVEREAGEAECAEGEDRFGGEGVEVEVGSEIGLEVAEVAGHEVGGFAKTNPLCAFFGYEEEGVGVREEAMNEREEEQERQVEGHDGQHDEDFVEACCAGWEKHARHCSFGWGVLQQAGGME